MNDSISKERLMEALGISDDCVDCQHRLNGLCLWKPNMVDVCEIISEMPSAERKGKWIPKLDDGGFTYGECSECGMKNYAGHTNYCPNCGADMRGEADG